MANDKVQLFEELSGRFHQRKPNPLNCGWLRLGASGLKK